jgi:hypothetical protein
MVQTRVWTVAESSPGLWLRQRMHEGLLSAW